MNPLIRLCGLNCHHCANDLLRRVGISECNGLQRSERMMADNFAAIQGVVPALHIATQLPAGLRKVRLKSAMGNPPYMLSPVKQTGEGRYRMLRGHELNALPTGGAPVVVRDGESPPHGEGEQFKSVCDAHYSTLMR